MVVAVGFTDTAGVTALFAVTVIIEEVAVVGLAQVAVDVSTTVTWAPFVKLAVVKLLLSVPAFTLFTFH
jgi:hypothetical protein